MSVRQPGRKLRQKPSRSQNKMDTQIELAPIAVRIPQAVSMLGMSRSKLYEFIKSGDIAIVKVGSSTLIPVASLQDFITTRQERA